MSKKIAVLGAGNGGYVMAADLSMVGHEVNLYELPEYADDNLGPVIQRGGIEVISQDPSGKEIVMSAGGRSGFTKISGKVSSDIKEVIKGVEIIMLVVPGFIREKFVRTFAPYLEDGQIILIWPAYFGALQCAKLLKDLGVKKDIAIGETESLIYNCTKLGNARVRNKGQKEKMLVSIFPSSKKEEAFNILQKIYPQFLPSKNVLETTLVNVNPPLHPQSVLLNLYRVERKFYPFDEKLNQPVEKAYDVTPGMARVMEQIDIERIKIGEKLGLTLNSLQKVLGIFYGAKGEDLYETISTCYAYQVQGAPTSLENRYVTEDIPYGLVPYTLLGEQIGLPVNAIRAMSTIGCAATGHNFWKEGLNMEKVGLYGKNAQEIIDFLE
ncbi:MAG: NAD/NADP octopine/nopaline dehydrogenase family protein [bacterium]